MRKLFLFISIITSMAVVSCHHHHDEHDHDHEHEHEAHEHEHEHGEHAHLQLVAYSDHWEVYAECHPFVVGEETHILAHFTKLENFKPRTAGSITAVLTLGGKSTRLVAESPEEPGIYEFEFEPTVEGKGTLTFYVDSDTLTIRDIQSYKDEEKALHEAAERQAKSSNGATFTKEQSWKVNFSTEPCRVEPFGQVIKTMAQVMPAQGDEQIITAKTSGIVLLAGNDIVVGKSVSKGQRLFSVESGDFVDNNLSVRYQEASSEYERAKSEYERKKELAKDKIVSESELQRAKSEYDKAVAAYKNYSRGFSGGKSGVSSPMSGYLKQIYVQHGQYVEAGAPIASVSQNKNLTIRANVQSKYYPLLSRIASANFKLSDGSGVYSLEELGGKVLSYGKATDVNNPQIPVTFQVNNTVDLLPGAFVETYIRTQSEQPIITIPSVALIEETGNYFVYVQLTPEYFEKREVTIGSTDGKRTEIKSGLTGSERVVAKGAILVKLAQASGKLDAHSGHHH